MNKMIKPEIELVRFDAEDVITTSADPSRIPLNHQDNPTTPTTEDPSQSQDYQNIGWNQPIHQ